MRRLQAAYRGFRGRRAALELLVALRRRRRAVRCDMAGNGGGSLGVISLLVGVIDSTYYITSEKVYLDPPKKYIHLKH